jgi:hypothetical protein
MKNRAGLVAMLAWIVPIVMFTTVVSANPGGLANRTQKSSQSGCGGCHGSSAAAGVVVTVSGPDTVVRGSATEFNVTISGGPASGSGVDIAARTGTLAAISSTLKLSGSDLVQKSNTAMSGGSITFRFFYSFNSAATTDTLYVTGLSTNSNGGTSGDQWNWSPKKALVLVQTATGVSGEDRRIAGFSLDQNYPNPFNPSTVIGYSLVVGGDVTLRIFDVRGREVATLVQGASVPGSFERTWDATGMASGVYYARLEVRTGSGTPPFVQTRKILLMK